MNVSGAEAESLLLAIRNEIFDEVDLAFVNAINIKQCGNYWSVLNCAAYYGKVSIVHLLLKNEKLIEKEDLNTSLHIAIEHRHTTVAELLLKHGVNVNSINGYNGLLNNFPQTLLHRAVGNNLKELTLQLLNKGANKEIRDDSGVTPLVTAVHFDYKDIVDILIEAGADTSVKNYFRETLLHLAVRNNSKEISLLLVNNGVNKDMEDLDGLTPLLIAVESNYKDIVDILIEAGADTSVTDDFHDTSLHLAVRNNSKEMTLLLIKNGADKEIRNDSGETPLLIAVKNNYKNIVNILVEAGANLNARDNNENTALHLACQTGCLSTVKLLLYADAGANINMQNATGCTPLYCATCYDHYHVLKLLLDRGADVTITDNSRNTVLHICVKHHNIKLIELLHKNGASVNSRNADGYDVLDLVFTGWFFRYDILKLLIKLTLYSNINTSKPERHNSVDFLKFWDSCKSELELMEMCKIAKSSISYRRLMLERNKSKLAAYCCNENIVRELDTLDYKNKFPIYNQYISEKIIEGEITLRLYYKADKVMNHISPFLPIEVRRIIYKYLSNDDLENLTGWDQHV